MNEYELEQERTALWAEIYATEGGDVDAALREACAELDALLAEAATWDQTVVAMREAIAQPASVALAA